MVFQISDDFEDELEDKHRGIESLMQNYVLLNEKEKSYRDFIEYTELLIGLLKEIHLYSNVMEELIHYLIDRVKKHI